MATALTNLQTQVLGALTSVPASFCNSTHVLAAIHIRLYMRAGLSDEDTLFHLQQMIDLNIIGRQHISPSLLDKLL